MIANRDYGLVFGKVMQQHPKADVRLVNDLLRTTLAVLVELDTERLRRAYCLAKHGGEHAVCDSYIIETMAEHYARLVAAGE